MSRALVLGIVAAGLLVLGPDPGWAQSAPSRRPPAREAAGTSGTAPVKPQPAAKRGPADPAARPLGDDKNAPVTVDADHLENLQKEGLVIFTGNVVASQNSSTQWADRMEVYLDAKGDRIVRTVSTGNVRVITRDCRTGTAQRAEYYDSEQRVVLIGNARVWREDNVVTGERITIFLAEDRSVVEGGRQERVKAVFYPKSQEQQKTDSRSPSGAPCN